MLCTGLNTAYSAGLYIKQTRITVNHSLQLHNTSITVSLLLRVSRFVSNEIRNMTMIIVSGYSDVTSGSRCSVIIFVENSRLERTFF